MGLTVCATVPLYSTVRVVRVLVVNWYCFEYSAITAVLVTCTVPDPVIVPCGAELITTAAAGTSGALVLTVSVPLTLMFVLTATVVPEFELAMVRLLKVVLAEPPITCAAEPFIVTVPERALKLAAKLLLVKSPATLRA